MGWISGIVVSCGVDCRQGLDLALLWLWRRLAPIVLIRPLAWVSPYAMSMTTPQKKGKRKKGLRYHYREDFKMILEEKTLKFA